MNLPRTDFLIPVRAPAPFFHECLRSIATQTRQPARTVVVMDGHSDQVEHACKESGIKGMHIVVLPPSSGIVAALNEGLAQCAGKFVARLDADDVALPRRVEIQEDYMDAHMRCVAMGTGVRLIDESGTDIGHRLPTRRGDALRTLRWRSPIAHPSAIVRRDVLESVGGYNSDAVMCEDFDLWLRLATRGEVHAIPEQLTAYRIHSQQVTKNPHFPEESLEAIRIARMALARARQESVVMTQVRHALWSLWQQRPRGTT